MISPVYPWRSMISSYLSMEILDFSCLSMEIWFLLSIHGDPWSPPIYPWRSMISLSVHPWRSLISPVYPRRSMISPVCPWRSMIFLSIYLCGFIIAIPLSMWIYYFPLSMNIQDFPAPIHGDPWLPLLYPCGLIIIPPLSMWSMISPLALLWDLQILNLLQIRTEVSRFSERRCSISGILSEPELYSPWRIKWGPGRCRCPYQYSQCLRWRGWQGDHMYQY